MARVQNPFSTPIGAYTRNQQARRPVNNSSGNQLGQLAGKAIGIKGGQLIREKVLNPITNELEEIFIDPLQEGAVDFLIENFPETAQRVLGEETLKAGMERIGYGMTDMILDAPIDLATEFGLDVGTSLATDAALEGGQSLLTDAATEQAATELATQTAGSATDAIIPGIGTAYGLHKTIQAIEDGSPVMGAISGAGTGISAGALASALGATSGGALASAALLGPLGALIGGGLAYGQQQNWGKGRTKLKETRRKLMQNQIKNAGFVTDEDGTTWLIGPDGQRVHVGEGGDDKFKLDFTGGMEGLNPNVNMTAGDANHYQNMVNRGYHYGDEIDWTHPEIGQIVAESTPLSLLISGTDRDDISQMTTGYLTNALLGSDTDSRQDWYQNKYKELGFESAEDIIARLGAMVESGALSEWEAMAAGNAVNQQFGVKNGPKTPEGYIGESGRQAYNDYMKGEALKLGKTPLESYMDERGYGMDIDGNLLG